MNPNFLRDKYNNLSVLVCGDMCLDKDYIGGYSGYSREKEQLPIFRTEIEKYNPGGGGNLSVCFSALGVKTIIAGFWGDEDDINRYILESSFRKRNIDTSGMVVGSRTPTYGKVYLHNGTHIYRIDLISDPVTEKEIAQLADKVKMLINSVDFVACADYEEANDFGVCTEKVIDIISNSSIPKFGTSRARIKNLKDFDHLLQNTKELIDQTELDKSVKLPIKSALLHRKSALLHRKSAWLQLIVEDFLRKLNVDRMIVTMGGNGATAFHLNNNGLENLLVSSKELMNNVDPCGCGDMFYAVYSSSIMAGFDTQTSIKLANSAARVVARKLFGTGQASPEEIVEEYKILYPEG